MGHVSVILMNVQGSDETVGMAIAKAAELIGNINTREASAVAAPALVESEARAISNRTVRESVKAVRKSVAKKVKDAADGAAAGMIHCPVVGCLREFSKRAWLNNHLKGVHDLDPV